MDRAPSERVRAILTSLCEELGLDNAYVDITARRVHPSIDARAELLSVVAALADTACEAADHAGEAAAALWLTDAVEGDPAPLRMAWALRLRALEHSSEDPGEDRVPALRRLHQAALAAIDAVEDASRTSGMSGPAVRSALDSIVEVAARAERALGLEPSPTTGDLERRVAARAAATPSRLSFLDKHGAGVTQIAIRDGQSWWHDRFAEKFGSEPPTGWWIADEEEPAGGHPAPAGADAWFDAVDDHEFWIEMETRYRAEMGLPARGDGWVSEAHLASCLEAVLPGVEVVRQARPAWLGTQRLDVYLPALDLAVEYQGEQHYLPLPHWGGEAGLAARRELDERKRAACFRAGVRLIEWRYDEPVSIDAVRRRLDRAGVPVRDE